LHGAKELLNSKAKTKVPDSIIKLHYREGELENLLRVRDKFVDLIQQYSNDENVLGRSKLLGSIFDTVFFIGISNMREHMPSVKEVYLNVGESRNASLRNLELLEELHIVTRIHDPDDSRVKRTKLTETFGKDFEAFIEAWVNSRKDPAQ
jgi:DNA-binding MarR family transcriptional regulator